MKRVQQLLMFAVNSNNPNFLEHQLFAALGFVATPLGDAISYFHTGLCCWAQRNDYRALHE